MLTQPRGVGVVCRAVTRPVAQRRVLRSEPGVLREQSPVRPFLVRHDPTMAPTSANVG